MDSSIEKTERTFWYTLARALFRLVFLVCPLHFEHTERLNRRAPYIVIANHLSWLDPMAIALICKRYEIRFLGKKELAASKLTAYLMHKLHMISVERHASDMQAMRACVKVLREGRVLGVFPEGTRHQKEMMGEVESGVSLLALRSQVPIVPVYIGGKIRPFHAVRVVVGEEIRYRDLIKKGSDKKTVDALTARIRRTFYQLRGKTGAPRQNN